MSLNLIRRRYEGIPQRPNLFGVEFGKRNDVIYWVTTINKLPDRQMELGSIPFMNGRYYYVNKEKMFGDVTMTFMLFEDMNVLTWLNGWGQTQFDIQTGIVGSELAAKDDINIFLLDHTGTQRTIQWTLNGCLLKTLGPIGQGGAFTMGVGAEVKQETVEATFTYEYFSISTNTDEGLV